LRVARLLRRIPRKQRLLPGRGNHPQQRRTQQHAGYHLRHDLRLAQPSGGNSHDAAGQQNNGNLQKEVKGQLQIVHGASAASAGAECSSSGAALRC